MKSLERPGVLARGELQSLKYAVLHLCEVGYAVSVSMRSMLGDYIGCDIVVMHPSGERVRAAKALEYVMNRILPGATWLLTRSETLTCGILIQIDCSAMSEVLTELPVTQALQYVGGTVFGACVAYYPTLRHELEAYDQIKLVLETAGFNTQEEEVRALAVINVDFAKKAGPK